MKILYISSLCSPKVLDYIFNTSEVKPGQAVQKFHRLLVEGFSKYNDICEIEVLSSLPVSPRGHAKLYWNFPDCLWKGVRFRLHSIY